MKKIIRNSIRNYSLSGLLLCYSAGVTNAQTFQIVHDTQKEKQLHAMESGKWDFEPDWWYYLAHKNYSGAEVYWQWAGFNSELRIRFKEEKSNVKRTYPTRVASASAQHSKFKKVKEEYNYIQTLYKDDLAKEADRMVDVTYPSYQDDFNRMQTLITEGLLKILLVSNGELKKQVTEIAQRNEVVCANVAYIRKSGPGYELENSKRQQEYEKARSQMQTLLRLTNRLASIAYYFYK